LNYSTNDVPINSLVAIIRNLTSWKKSYPDPTASEMPTALNVGLPAVPPPLLFPDELMIAIAFPKMLTFLSVKP